MTDKLMKKIEELDEEIRAKKKEILNLRNNWLRNKGWEVTSATDAFYDLFIYKKHGKLFMCEHEAIDAESNGDGVVSRPVKVVDDGVERIGAKLLAGETAYTPMSTDPAAVVVTVFVGKTN